MYRVNCYYCILKQWIIILYFVGRWSISVFLLLWSASLQQVRPIQVCAKATKVLCTTAPPAYSCKAKKNLLNCSTRTLHCHVSCHFFNFMDDGLRKRREILRREKLCGSGKGCISVTVT